MHTEIPSCRGHVAACCALVVALCAYCAAPAHAAKRRPAAAVRNAVASSPSGTNGVAAAKSDAASSAQSSTNSVVAARPTIESRLFRLNHASAAEVAAKFNEMWNGEFGQVWKVSRIAVDFPESNSVMVTAPAPILEACGKAISEIDVDARQVYIEARFVELSNNASHKIGIDWQLLNGMGGSAKLSGGLQTHHVGRAVKDFSRTTTEGNTLSSYMLDGGSGSNGNITYFNGTLDFSEMSIILRALEFTEDAKTFSNPKIIVSSGKKAIVDMTQKYPNVKISAKRTTSGGGADSLDLDMQMAEIPGEDKFMFAKEAFFSWGIQLEVTPRISTNGLINVQVVPTISDCSGYVTAGTETDTVASGTYSSKYPIINVQRLVTEFNLASGTTAVIGGLSRTVEHQTDNGIPFLRDIPWIGPKLFGSKVRVKEQHEIVVFVTVGLVDPVNMQKDAGLPKNAVLGRQYVEGHRLEPGDKNRDRVEGLKSLDLRPLEEQIGDSVSGEKRLK